jgi:hypothetical protein
MQKAPLCVFAAFAKKVFGKCQKGLWQMPKGSLANAAT